MWRLSEEWLLHDTERVLLKFLFDMDSWWERQWQGHYQHSTGAPDEHKPYLDTRQCVLQAILDIQVCLSHE